MKPKRLVNCGWVQIEERFGTCKNEVGVGVKTSTPDWPQKHWQNVLAQKRVGCKCHTSAQKESHPVKMNLFIGLCQCLGLLPMFLSSEDDNAVGENSGATTWLDQSHTSSLFLPIASPFCGPQHMHGILWTDLFSQRVCGLCASPNGESLSQLRTLHKHPFAKLLNGLQCLWHIFCLDGLRDLDLQQWHALWESWGLGRHFTARRLWGCSTRGYMTLCKHLKIGDVLSVPDLQTQSTWQPT